MRTPADVLVLGAGVTGLTTAICLAERGVRVRVRARDRPRQTTSCAAGAIWGPYLVDDERVLRWSEESRGQLSRLVGEPGTGVRLVFGLEASARVVPPPAWATGLADFRRSQPAELPDGYASGWWYSAPVVDMPVYLDYLLRRLAGAGGRLELGTTGALRELVGQAAVVVNCTGLGARELVPDPRVSPTRGQLVVVENPGLDQFFVEHDETPEPTYFLPHGDRVVLGGSAEPGRTDLAPDLSISEAIQRRCARIAPALAGARVVEHRIGLRPSRHRVRLERTDLAGRPVVHNYGHGGSGLTLSWGCAAEVLALVAGA